MSITTPPASMPTEAKAIRTVSGALDVLNAKLGGAAGDIPADATKVDALKKVYATLGGTPTDVADISTTSEMIEKLAAVAEGGGGGGDCPTLEEMAIDVLQTIPAQTVNITIEPDGGSYFGETKIADLNEAAAAAVSDLDLSFTFAANGISGNQFIDLGGNWSINYRDNAIYLAYFSTVEPSPLPTEYNAPEIIVYIATDELKEIFYPQLIGSR